jgi:hypothetical protein
VRFSVVDAADLGGAGGYDLVTIFEALHDMAGPVDALSAARRVLADDGTVLVVDGLVAEEFTVPASPRERTEYGWSVVSCLPGAMGDPQTAATGAVMRPSMLHQYALQAGFSGLEVPNPHRLLALLPTATVRPTRVARVANLSAIVQQSPSQTSRAATNPFLQVDVARRSLLAACSGDQRWKTAGAGRTSRRRSA